MTPKEIVNRAIYAALGCTKIDRRSLKGTIAAAEQITEFVMGHLADENFVIIKHPTLIDGGGGADNRTTLVPPHQGGGCGMSDREFLFEYRFGGCEWGITIHAANADEARRKIKAAGLARYKGEVHATIPVGSPMTTLGWLAGLLVLVTVIGLAVSQTG